jgi:GABA(A) receptor-associated protein
MKFCYKNEVPDIEVRRRNCLKLIEKNPDKIPIIFEKDPKSNIESFPKTRYLINKDLTVNHFLLLLRNKLKVDETSAFFLLVDGKIYITGDKTLQDIYIKYKDKKDGFLYLMYSTEQIWG